MNPDGSNVSQSEPKPAEAPFTPPQPLEINAAPKPEGLPQVGEKVEEKPKENKEKAKTPEEENLAHFDEASVFSFGLGLVWLVAIVVALATGYFWWLNRNLANILEDKNTKKSAVISQLESPANKKIEIDASNFKSSVAALNTAKTNRISLTKFLPDLYAKIDNDVMLSSITIDSKEGVTLAGKTKSYRTIADQAMALKSWERLSEVDIASPTFSTNPEDAALPAKFTMTAKINKETTTAASATAAPASAGSASTSGGTQ